MSKLNFESSDITRDTFFKSMISNAAVLALYDLLLDEQKPLFIQKFKNYMHSLCDRDLKSLGFSDEESKMMTKGFMSLSDQFDKK